LPKYVRLLTQRIGVSLVEGLSVPLTSGIARPDGGVEEETHDHPAYGRYHAGSQTIEVEASLGFECQRETFLHENLHAMLNAAKLQDIAPDIPGLGEHFVDNLAPVLLCWLRENPTAVLYLQQTQRAAPRKAVQS
jgi:hypothetical protein